MAKNTMKTKTIIIAEIGVNHNGSLNVAKKLIDKAKSIGATFAKFQVYSIDEIAHEKSTKAEYQNKALGKKISQLEMLKKLNLTHEDHQKLFIYAKKKNIKYMASGFSKKDFYFLKKIGCKYFKIPSGEITNLNLLKYVGSLNRKIILSTGASTIKEIKIAFKYLKKGGAKNSDITILHCNSAYPTPLKDCNLKSINTIKKIFKTSVGYSDHTSQIDIPAIAVALGAEVIEKHFTLNNEMKGPDHKSSLNPRNFELMIEKIENTEIILGNGIKKPSTSEIKNIKFIRRGIYSKKNIKKNEIFSEKNIFCIRPLNKNGAENWFNIIGKKSKKNYFKNQTID
jgi:N,N'-diacetyllegionaminate synthase